LFWKFGGRLAHALGVSDLAFFLRFSSFLCVLGLILRLLDDRLAPVRLDLGQRRPFAHRGDRQDKAMLGLQAPVARIALLFALGDPARTLAASFRGLRRFRGFGLGRQLRLGFRIAHARMDPPRHVFPGRGRETLEDIDPQRADEGLRFGWILRADAARGGFHCGVEGFPGGLLAQPQGLEGDKGLFDGGLLGVEPGDLGQFAAIALLSLAGRGVVVRLGLAFRQAFGAFFRQRRNLGQPVLGARLRSLADEANQFIFGVGEPRLQLPPDLHPEPLAQMGARQVHEFVFAREVGDFAIALPHIRLESGHALGLHRQPAVDEIEEGFFFLRQVDNPHAMRLDDFGVFRRRHALLLVAKASQAFRDRLRSGFAFFHGPPEVNDVD